VHRTIKQLQVTIVSILFLSIFFLLLLCYSFICTNKLQAEYDVLSNWNDKIESELRQRCISSLMITEFVKETFEPLNAHRNDSQLNKMQQSSSDSIAHYTMRKEFFVLTPTKEVKSMVRIRAMLISMGIVARFIIINRHFFTLSFRIGHSN